MTKTQMKRLARVQHKPCPGQDMGTEYRTEPRRPVQASRRVSSKEGFNPRSVTGKTTRAWQPL